MARAARAAGRRCCRGRALRTPPASAGCWCRCVTPLLPARQQPGSASCAASLLTLLRLFWDYPEIKAFQRPRQAPRFIISELSDLWKQGSVSHSRKQENTWVTVAFLGQSKCLAHPAAACLPASTAQAPDLEHRTGGGCVGFRLTLFTLLRFFFSY